MQLTKASSTETDRKDKLSEKKRAERAKHELHKAELQRHKSEKEEETSKLKQALRQLRTFGHSKRGEREAREAAKREKHAETGRRNAEEDSQPPRVASYSHSRQLWAERVDRLLREHPDGLPYEPASSKEILPFPDLGDEKGRLKELADKIKTSGKTPINHFTWEMPLYTAAGAVTRPPPGCSPLEEFRFFWDHMWNLPALPSRPLLGNSAAQTPSTAAICCPASGKSMALTGQEAQGSTLSGLCRPTHSLGAAALLPQTVASLAPAPAKTERAAAAALTAANSLAWAPPTAAIRCPASGKEMALTGQEAQGSMLPRLCRTAHSLGATALLPQTVASLAPAPADETRRAAAAALMTAPAGDRPIVLPKTATTMALARIIRTHILAIAATHGDAVISPAAAGHVRKLLSEGSAISSHLATMQLIIVRGPRTLIASLASSRMKMYTCFNMRAGCPAAKRPDDAIALSVWAGPLTLSLPSLRQSAQAVDPTSAPDATLALLHPPQNPSSAHEGTQWWSTVHSWAQDSCLRFVRAMQRVMKKAASPHLGRSMLTALRIQPAVTALEHAPGPRIPVRRHGARSTAGIRVAGIIRRDTFTIMALIGDRSVSHDIVGAIHCQLERGQTRSAHLALARFFVTQGRRMAVISSACLHSMAAANSHMPAWPAPALAARPGRLHLLLWTLTLDRPLVTHTELYRLTAQPAAEQDTAHSDPPATNPPPGAEMATKAVCLGLAAAESASALVAGKRGARAFRALLPMAYRLAGAAIGAGDCIRHLLHSGCQQPLSNC